MCLGVAPSGLPMPKSMMSSPRRRAETFVKARLTAALSVAALVSAARNAGAGVLLISFELDEIFACADRVLVIANGAFVGSFVRAEIDRGRIGALMAGHA